MAPQDHPSPTSLLPRSQGEKASAPCHQGACLSAEFMSCLASWDLIVVPLTSHLPPTLWKTSSYSFWNDWWKSDLEALSSRKGRECGTCTGRGLSFIVPLNLPAEVVLCMLPSGPLDCRIENHDGSQLTGSTHLPHRPVRTDVTYCCDSIQGQRECDLGNQWSS